MALTASLSTGVTSTVGMIGAADASAADARLSMRSSAEEEAGSTTASTVTALVAVEGVLAREFRAVVNTEIRRSRTPSESSDDGVLVLVFSVVACSMIGKARGKTDISRTTHRVRPSGESVEASHHATAARVIAPLLCRQHQYCELHLDRVTYHLMNDDLGPLDGRSIGEGEYWSRK